jgi:hypothetical protein
MQLPAQAMALGNHGVVEVFQQLIDSVVSHGGFLVVQVSLLLHDRHRKGWDCRRFAPPRHGRGEGDLCLAVIDLKVYKG